MAASSTGSSSIAASTRSSLMIIANGKLYRVKAVMHGNQRACEEITMQKLYELVAGTNSPHTLFGINFNTRPEFSNITGKRDFDFNQKNGIPNIYVASPFFADAFEDLGLFLVSTARHLIGDEKEYDGDVIDKNSNYKKLRAEILAIEGNTAKDKILRRDKLFKIFDLLPDKIRSKLDITYYKSLWLGNWDLFNFALFNTGFLYNPRTKELDKRFLSAIVDFGNCGPTGFGGLYKEESLLRANTPAKEKPNGNDEKSDRQFDYDPELGKFQHIQAQDATLRSTPSSRVSLASLPRNLPFSQLFAKQVKMEREEYDWNPKNQILSLMNEALEAAYCLLLVCDKAIDRVIDKWYLIGDDKPIPFLELSKTDFDKIYPPQAINDVINLLKKDPNTTIKDLQKKYSSPALNELMLNIQKAITKHGYEINETFPTATQQGTITQELFDFVKQFSKAQILGWAEKNPKRAEFLEKDAIKRVEQYGISSREIYDLLNDYRKELVAPLSGPPETTGYREF